MKNYAPEIDRDSLETHFNIALFPEDREFIAECIHLAKSNCSQQFDEYLLGENAWPHITLCEFMTEANSITNIWMQIKDLLPTPLFLHLHHVYILPGRDEHTSKYWLGLAIEPEMKLFELQKSIYNRLYAMGIKSKTLPANYFPHLTWARCKKPPLLQIFPEQNIWKTAQAFTLSLGSSNQYGAYRERLLFPV